MGVWRKVPKKKHGKLIFFPTNSLQIIHNIPERNHLNPPALSHWLGLVLHGSSFVLYKNWSQPQRLEGVSYSGSQRFGTKHPNDLRDDRTSRLLFTWWWSTFVPIFFEVNLANKFRTSFWGSQIRAECLMTTEFSVFLDMNFPVLSLPT